MTDRWEDVDLPILQFVAEHETEFHVQVGALAEAIGSDPAIVAIEVERLIEAGYLGGTMSKPMAGGSRSPWHFQPVLLERGARAVGVWPAADPYQALLDSIDRRIAEEQEPDERSRLQKLRSAAGEIGRGVLVGVLLDVAKKGGL